MENISAAALAYQIHPDPVTGRQQILSLGDQQSIRFLEVFSTVALAF